MGQLDREAGISASEAGKFGVAIYYAQEALKQNPADAGLRANLAIAHLFAGNLQAVKSEGAAAVAAEPNDQVSRSVGILIGEVSSGRMPRPKRTSDIDLSRPPTSALVECVKARLSWVGLASCSSAPFGQPSAVRR